jgi:hypothetical protein
MTTAVQQSEYIYHKVFPSVNNEDLLEFRIPANVKNQMHLENTVLHFTVEIPQIKNGLDVLPQNFLGPKQFSSLEIRINGDPISRRSCSNEYFLASYFQNLASFNAGYRSTACQTMGIFDNYNFTTHYLKKLKQANVYEQETMSRRDLSRKFVNYEIMMPIDSSIFYSNNFLPSNTPMELSFERAKSSFSLIMGGDTTSAETDNLPRILELEDVYLMVPFTKHEKTQQLEKHVSRPIKIKYDDFVINRFNLTNGSKNIRIPNALYGPFPKKIFWGLQQLSAYTGSFQDSSSNFAQFEQTKASIYIDGNMVSGYPVTMSTHGITQPYQKFLENTNKFLNCYAGKTLTPNDFQTNFIHSATLCPDNGGTITFDFDFKTPLSSDLVLITCSIFDRKLELDNVRNFKVK